MTQFHSVNFKIALLEEFLEDDSMKKTFKELEKKCKSLNKKKPSPTELNPEISQFIKDIILSQEQLESIVNIRFDGGSEIYQIIEPDWDGEDDLFQVFDLHDVASLPNLESIEDTTLCTVSDASPLLQLENLEYVDVNYGYGIKDETSIKLLQAKGVEIGNEETTEEDEREESSSENLFTDKFNNAYTLLWDEGNPEEALEIFSELTKEKPLDPDCWLQKGNALYDLERYEEAHKAWLKCLELDPEDYTANYNVANVLFEKRDYIKALSFIDNAIEYGAEDYAEAYHIKAQLTELLGDRLTASQLFEKTLQMYLNELEEEESSETLFQVACVYNRLNKTPESLKFLKKAVDLDPDNAERAIEDKDFKNLLDNKDFIKITK